MGSHQNWTLKVGNLCFFGGGELPLCSLRGNELRLIFSGLTVHNPIIERGMSFALQCWMIFTMMESPSMILPVIMRNLSFVRHEISCSLFTVIYVFIKIIIDWEIYNDKYTLVTDTSIIGTMYFILSICQRAGGGGG